MVSQRAYEIGQRNAQSYDVNTPRQLVCPQCQTQTHDSVFCPGCGYRLADTAACGSCQVTVPTGAVFCPGCGTRQ
jgi:RNA polymerase subunit RPABC4/transcription elongation factor Spt4